MLPVPAGLVELARDASLVVTVEDNGRRSGAGVAIAATLAESGVRVPVVNLGIPQQFLPVGKRAAMLAEFDLTAEGLRRRWSRLGAESAFREGHRGCRNGLTTGEYGR